MHHNLPMVVQILILRSQTLEFVKNDASRTRPDSQSSSTSQTNPRVAPLYPDPLYQILNLCHETPFTLCRAILHYCHELLVNLHRATPPHPKPILCLPQKHYNHIFILG
jgi:hypothetical protein